MVDFLLTQVTRQSNEFSAADILLTPFRWAAGGKTYKITLDVPSGTEKISRADTNTGWIVAAKRVIGVIGSFVFGVTVIPLFVGVYLKYQDKEAKSNFDTLNRHRIQNKVVNLNLENFTPKNVEPKNVFYGLGSGDKPYEDMCVLTSELWTIGGQEQIRQELMEKFAILGKGRAFGDGIWEETKDLRNYILGIKELLSAGLSDLTKRAAIIGLYRDLRPLKDGKDTEGACLKAVKERYEVLLEGQDHQAQKILRELGNQVQEVGKKILFKTFGNLETDPSSGDEKMESFKRVFLSVMSDLKLKNIPPETSVMLAILQSNKGAVTLSPEELLQKEELVQTFFNETAPIHIMNALKANPSLGNEDEIIAALRDKLILEIVE